MALVGSTNDEKIWNYLKEKGFNDYAVSGIMGNLYAESGLMPNNLQNTGNSKLGMTDDEYVAAIDNGSYGKDKFIYDSQGFGLAQWTYWSRKKSLYEFVKNENKSIGDLEAQLDFFVKELTESFSSLVNTLKSATSILQASNAVLFKYENPADQSVLVQNTRSSYGQVYYDKYVNKESQKIQNTGDNTMTEKELREKVVSIAKGYYGCKESDGSHKKIIDIYNQGLLPYGYRMTYSDPWCATYVSSVGIKAGLSDIIYKECGCERMIELYKKAGRFVEDDSYIPNVADIIFYDWDDNGIGDNTGFSDHVGIVVSVNGNTMKIIEGNISSSVGYRTIQVNARYIRGYGIPNYASKATKETVSTPQVKPSSTVNKTETQSVSNVKKNDIVKIASNATYYNGGSVPTWVKNITWVVSEVVGNRAVIDKSSDGKNSIYSPIDTKYLTVVSSASTKEIVNGTKLNLKNVPLYAAAALINKTTNITGTYYVWKKEVVKNRIRITNSVDNVAKPNQVTGWIDYDYAKKYAEF